MYVAVAFAAKRVDDALAGDNADKFRAAHDGEVLLQRVDAADECVGERVRRRERGEIGEHYFAHPDCVDHGLEEDALVLNLRADHDEESGDDEPVAVNQHAADHYSEREQLAESRGGASRRRKAVGTRMKLPLWSSRPEIERVGREQVEDSQAGLHPHHAAQQPCGCDERASKQIDIPAGSDEGKSKHDRCHDVGERPSMNAMPNWPKP